MRFIGVVAAVAAAVGTTFDFGLTQDHHAATSPPAEWVRVSAAETESSDPAQGGETYRSLPYSANAPELAMARD